MKKFIIFTIIFAFCFCGCKQNEIYEPLVESPIISTEDNNIIKGVWFSYLEFDKYLCGKTEKDFRETFNNIVDNCKSLGINTMFVQVRSHSDSCYVSNIFPLSSHLCGKLGGTVDFDALSIMTETCHNKSVDIHAWVNPYRAYTEEEMNNLPVENIIKKWYNEKKNIYLEKGRYYLNPASKEVTTLICDGIEEILNYDIDGIHFDDYFYPSVDVNIDKSEYQKSGYNDLSQFRLDSVSKLISSVYKLIKENKPEILFGVSPQGNIDNNYNSQYADVKRWCNEAGFIDYIAPQIYYGFNNQTAPYSKTILKWQEIITNKNVKIIGGLAAYKIGKVDMNAGNNGQNEWIEENNILSRQIEELSKVNNYGGIIFYRYENLFDIKTEQIKKEIETIKGILN